jgi:hypothetical protein
MCSFVLPAAASGLDEDTEPFNADHVALHSSKQNWNQQMGRQLDRYDWRRADRLDPSVLITAAIGIVFAVALANLL